MIFAKKINNVFEVARYRLCVGCGACTYICPEGNVKLVDVQSDGIRPIEYRDGCGVCGLCLKACPGFKTAVSGCKSKKVPGGSAQTKWGEVIEFWEGFAADPEIRFKGSSGGLCTALSLFCLENGTAGGVLHIGSKPENPWCNATVRSTCRDELISRTGSRYSPASPCDGLKQIEEAVDRSVFIGKPCDVAGLRMAQAIKPELARKLELSIGFFCAGTPSTLGTLEFLRNHGVEPDTVADLRYRGMGWPGMATARLKGHSAAPLQWSYPDSWGFVQKYRPFRCYLCPDLTAEFADISVGDPWYREVGEKEPGRSLVLIRTAKGREVFHQAMAAGYIMAEPSHPEIIYRSQKNLLGKRQEIWGRLLAMWILGIPCPQLEGFHLFDNWLELPAKAKIKSILGTVRRIIRRNYFKPLDYTEYTNNS
jgi:coenzyme F420 hydrogenase subunit beta